MKNRMVILQTERCLICSLLAKHEFGYVESENVVWKQRSWFMLSLQICGGERKESSLSDSPRHALQLGLLFMA